MKKPKIFVTRLIPEEGLERLRQDCEVEVWPEELPPSRAQLLEKVRGVEGILSMLSDPIDAAVMDAAGPGLKVIANYAVGYDNIDTAEAARRGIAVGNTPGVLTDATADLAFALLMAAARRVVEGDAYVRAGRWKTWGPKLLLGPDIAGATLGIIGFGRIGRAVAQRAAGFRMRVLFNTSTVRPDVHADGIDAAYADLDTLLAQSDFISLHCPLTPGTQHLINREAFEKMKPTAILINTARGAVVDTQALYEALKTRRIAYAALDVTDPEPLPADHPLLTLENALVVPHIGSGSIAARSKMSLMTADNLLAGLRGEPLPHPVVRK